MPDKEFKHERVKDPKTFDPRSFRTVKVGRHRVIVGCPTGSWDTKGKRCKVGTRVQAILHPESMSNPCLFCRLEKWLEGL